MLACCLLIAAQELGYWRASSSTAQSVTGDVAFSDTKLTMNFTNFEIVHARDLQPGEISSVFDADSNSANKGHLYRLNIHAAKKFLHKNSLCGSEDTHWMAVYVQGRQLDLAFFSGQKPPVFSLDAISNSTDLCGRFIYTR